MVTVTAVVISLFASLLRWLLASWALSVGGIDSTWCGTIAFCWFSALLLSGAPFPAFTANLVRDRDGLVARLAHSTGWENKKTNG